MRRTVLLAALGLILVAAPASAQGAKRGPWFGEVDLGLSARPGLAPAWGGVSFSGDVRAGAGLWFGRRLAGFATVGLLAGATHETTTVTGLTSPVVERFKLLPVRGGVKLSLWPRPDWIDLNLVGGVSLATGFREYVNGNDVLGRENLFSVGFGGGLELSVVKFKRMGATLKVQYYLQPALLAEDTGFLTGGLTELGGLEVSLGWIVFLGGPTS